MMKNGNLTEGLSRPPPVPDNELGRVYFLCRPAGVPWPRGLEGEIGGHLDGAVRSPCPTNVDVECGNGVGGFLSP